MSRKTIGVEEKLPPIQALPLGLQHFLSMFGATVLVPMLMGFSPSVSVMCSGIGTALYLLVTRGKIPSYLGPSFSFIGPVVMASATAGASGWLGHRGRRPYLYPVRPCRARGGNRLDHPFHPRRCNG